MYDVMSPGNYSTCQVNFNWLKLRLVQADEVAACTSNVTDQSTHMAGRYYSNIHISLFPLNGIIDYKDVCKLPHNSVFQIAIDE